MTALSCLGPVLIILSKMDVWSITLVMSLWVFSKLGADRFLGKLGSLEKQSSFECPWAKLMSKAEARWCWLECFSRIGSCGQIHCMQLSASILIAA